MRLVLSRWVSLGVPGLMMTSGVLRPSAEQAPGGVALAFEPEAHLGVGSHPVLADDAVASSPSAGDGGVLAVAVLGYQGGELGLERSEGKFGCLRSLTTSCWSPRLCRKECAVDEGVLINREFATLIVFVAGLGLVVFKARDTGRFWPSIRGLFSALVQWQLLVPLLLYVVWVSAVVGGAAWIGLWSPDLLKPTVLWMVLAGFGLFFRSSEAIAEPGFFRRVLVRTVRVMAVIEYVVNLASFPLWAEILTQALAVLFSLFAVVGDDPKHAPVRRLANGYLGTLGLLAMGWTAWQVASEWQAIDFRGLMFEFLVPIWLTPPTLVFVYLVATWAVYETAFAQMRFSGDGRNLFRQKLAVVLRAAGRRSVLRLLRSGSWHIGRTGGFRDAWREIGKVILRERDRVTAEKALQRRLAENVGRVGVDTSGKQLDQREHHETTEALRALANQQFRHYHKNNDRYQTNIETEYLAEREGLPTPSGIRIHVDRTGQRWYAERQTITGHWFAIGAAAPPTDQWMYDGPQRPTDYPNETEWDHWMGDSNAPNWD